MKSFFRHGLDNVQLSIGFARLRIDFIHVEPVLFGLRTNDLRLCNNFVWDFFGGLQTFSLKPQVQI